MTEGTRPYGAGMGMDCGVLEKNCCEGKIDDGGAKLDEAEENCDEEWGVGAGEKLANAEANTDLGI